MPAMSSTLRERVLCDFSAKGVPPEVGLVVLPEPGGCDYRRFASKKKKAEPVAALVQRAYRGTVLKKGKECSEDDRDSPSKRQRRGVITPGLDITAVQFEDQEPHTGRKHRQRRAVLRDYARRIFTEDESKAAPSECMSFGVLFSFQLIRMLGLLLWPDNRQEQKTGVAYVHLYILEDCYKRFIIGIMRNPISLQV